MTTSSVGFFSSRPMAISKRAARRAEVLSAALLIVFGLLSMTGCASITGSKLQPLSVQTVLDNREVSGIGCTLTNDAGKWFVTTPGTVTVQKSTADLSVQCR